jgi:hypothetical protein
MSVNSVTGRGARAPASDVGSAGSVEPDPELEPEPIQGAPVSIDFVEPRRCRRRPGLFRPQVAWGAPSPAALEGRPVRSRFRGLSRARWDPPRSALESQPGR